MSSFIDSRSHVWDLVVATASMASKESAVYIAGVGLSLSNSSTSIDDIVLSAGTKALLDAGITYDDVNQSIACFLDRNLNVERKSFDTFGRTGTPVYKVDNYSGIHVAAQLVKSGSVDVVMVAGFDEVRTLVLGERPS